MMVVIPLTFLQNLTWLNKGGKMNTNRLLKTMNDKSLTLNQRTEAAGQLWETMNRLQKQLKYFKAELSKNASELNQDLFIPSESGRFLTSVEKQPPTPKLESVQIEDIEQILGEQFNKYIAHSYTIKWSEFRQAPQEIRDSFYSIPNLEVGQTYQVKFNKK